MARKKTGDQRRRERLRHYRREYVRLKTRLRSEEHTSELQSLRHLVCGLLLEKKNILAGMKYHPQDSRGTALHIAQDTYRPGTLEAALARANQRATVLTEIATSAGVTHTDSLS